jgi:hypothetical protein
MVALGQVGGPLDAWNLRLAGNVFHKVVYIIAKSAAGNPFTSFLVSEGTCAKVDGVGTLAFHDLGHIDEAVSRTAAGENPHQFGLVVVGESLDFIFHAFDTSRKRAAGFVFLATDQSNFRHPFLLLRR